RREGANKKKRGTLRPPAPDYSSFFWFCLLRLGAKKDPLLSLRGILHEVDAVDRVEVHTSGGLRAIRHRAVPDDAVRSLDALAREVRDFATRNVVDADRDVLSLREREAQGDVAAGERRVRERAEVHVAETAALGARQITDAADTH